jgi:hypothetical protein
MAVISFVQIWIVGRVHVIVEVEDHPVAVGGADPALVKSSDDIVLRRSYSIPPRKIAVTARVVARVEEKGASAADSGALARPVTDCIGVVRQMQLRIELSGVSLR